MEGRLVGGRYRLAGELGRGGMGVVWRAHDELLDRPVALKEVLLPSSVTQADREEALARVMREARAAARLRHSSVVTIYDVVTEDGHPWIAMELLPAVSLDDRIRDSGPLTEDEAAEMGLQILDALRVAHREGIMHRDIKPANVMLLDGGGAVLTDFGIAQIQGDAKLTATGMLVGSPGFMAPERIEGTKEAGGASDLWSLGATLYAAVEGRQPFHRSTPMAVLAAVLTQPSEPMTNARLLAPVINGLLEKDPEARMTREQAVEALQHLRPEPEPPRERRELPKTTNQDVRGRPVGERVAVWLLGGTALIALVLAGGELAANLDVPLHAAMTVFLVGLLAATFMLGEVIDPAIERLEWSYAVASAAALAAAVAVWPLNTEVSFLPPVAYGATGVWFLLVALSTWQQSRVAAVLLAVSGLCMADTALTGSRPAVRAAGWVLYALWAGAAMIRSGRTTE